MSFKIISRALRDVRLADHALNGRSRVEGECTPAVVIEEFDDILAARRYLFAHPGAPYQIEYPPEYRERIFR